MYFLSCVEIKTIIIIIIIIIIVTRTYDPRKNQDGSNSLKKKEGYLLIRPLFR